MAAFKQQRGGSPYRFGLNASTIGLQQPALGSPRSALKMPRLAPQKNAARGLAQLSARASPSRLEGSSAMLDSSCSMDESSDFCDRGKENICVTVRFRPLNERENLRGDEAAWYVDGDTVRSEYNPSILYAYDKVFGAVTTTRTVYDSAARHVVRGAMGGVNGTVFAYGVTSSGKTHTMHGDQNCPGVVPLAVKDVFGMIQETPGREFLLRVTYLEIYNEVINDLLDPAGQNLRIREDAQGTYVEGAKEEVVLSPSHALSLISAGEEHRHVGSNNFNLFSSRSHTIFTLTIESSLRSQGADDEVTLSQLNLIDLAGSESSKTETTGLRRKEGSYINKSLLTLGTVISKLSEGRASHIPYRDSKLTRLLQSSLSGHGRISLICTITPASSNIEETHNTLKFAQRAKRIAIYAAPNRIMDEKSLIKKYQKEIANLRNELQLMKRGMVGSAYSTTSQEDLITLREQLEAGQLKMRSRLEEEEVAKAALMGRIHKLTKLILVSTKNNLSGSVDSGHQRRSSLAESEERYDDQSDIDGSTMGIPDCTEERSEIGETVESDNVADQIDLTREQVKMLAGEIALRSSSLKRLTEQATNRPNDPEIQVQLQKLKEDIEDKRNQMQLLEQRVMELSKNSSSHLELSQTVTKLTGQLNEKSFELEIRTADNRVLEEHLKNKVAEITQLEEKNTRLQQQLQEMMQKLNQPVLAPQRPNRLDMDDTGAWLHNGENSPAERNSESRRLVRKHHCDTQREGLLQAELELLKKEKARASEERNVLMEKNLKLEEDAAYAKDLAAGAAAEIKDLTEQVKKLALQNAELSAEVIGASSQVETLEKELQASKEAYSRLEQDLLGKSRQEAELKKKLEEAKQREADLENDLGNMWLLVGKMKMEEPLSQASILESAQVTTSTLNIKRIRDQHKELERLRSASPAADNQDTEELKTLMSQLKGENLDDLDAAALEDLQTLHIEALTKLCSAKAKIQDRKKQGKEEARPEAGLRYDEERHGHICKICFEAPTAAVLLPCRHFCLCQQCAVACTECPLCRTSISDRIVTYAS